jgi:hypothetical protein
MSGLLGQLPTLPPGALETWLMCALVVCNMVIAVKALARREPTEREFVTQKEFRDFRASVEGELGRLRLQSERQHALVIEKLSAIEAGLARLDERTKE